MSKAYVTRSRLAPARESGVPEFNRLLWFFTPPAMRVTKSRIVPKHVEKCSGKRVLLRLISSASGQAAV
ncbi:MAG: hypothetical protein KAX89_02210, partial [Propionivibrio sp.]|nr:hypothetical protein [Propionivibrio sp.]